MAEQSRPRAVDLLFDLVACELFRVVEQQTDDLGVVVTFVPQFEREVVVAPNVFRNRTQPGEADAETGQPARAVSHLLPVRLPTRVLVRREQFEHLGLRRVISLQSPVTWEAPIISRSADAERGPFRAPGSIKKAASTSAAFDRRNRFRTALRNNERVLGSRAKSTGKVLLTGMWRAVLLRRNSCIARHAASALRKDSRCVSHDCFVVRVPCCRSC